MASVTYRIGGKYDGKAIKSAKKDFDSLGKTVQSIGNIVKGLALVKGVQAVTKFANAQKDIFVQQNKALTNFNTAVAKTNLNITKLNQLKDRLSRGNFIDGDSLNNAAALGVELGLTETQLEKVLSAATDLNAAGVMPLDQAVKSLSMSYSGNVSQLAKLNPELKNLTKTELENGKAVDIIAGKYDGFADAMSKTFDGRNTQWNNATSDLKAAIGSIPQSLQFVTQGNLLEPLNKITEWITDNRNQIINFFLHLPEIFVSIGKSLTNAFKKTFENFPSWINSVGVLFVDMFKDSFSTLVKIATEAFKGIASLVDFAIGNPFRSSKDFINVMLNNMIEGINALPQKFPNWVKSILGIDEKTEPIKFRFSTGSSGNNKTWDETAKAIEKSMGNVIKAYKDGTKKTKDDWIKILDASTEFYKEDIDGLKKQLKDILGQDLPADLQSALEGLTFTNSNTPTGEEKKYTAKQLENGKGLNTIGTTALSSSGEIGSIVSAGLNGGIWGIIAELLNKIFNRLEEVSPIFKWFQNIFSDLIDTLFSEDNGFISAIENMIKPFQDGFNAVKEILSGVLNLVAGIINSITPVLTGLTMILNKIAPLVAGILDTLGMLFNFVGIILDMFNPVIEIILDVIAPVLEIINTIIKGLYTAIATIINVVIDIYNAITWGSKKDHISTELKTSPVTSKYDSYTPDLSGYASTNATNSSSGSASYTAAKDIYININFTNSFVNGDARDIALMLREEIRNAEKLGY